MGKVFLFYLTITALLVMNHGVSQSNCLSSSTVAHVANTTAEMLPEQGELKITTPKVEEEDDLRCLPGKEGLECRKQKRRQTLMHENLSFDDKIAAFERKKRLCSLGEYLDTSKNTCEKCENYCSEDNLSLCGLECRDYFNKMTITQEMKSMQRSFESKLKAQNTLTIVSIGTNIAWIIFSAFILWSYVKLTKKVDAVEAELRRMKARNLGMPASDEEPGVENVTDTDGMIPKKRQPMTAFCC